MRRQRIEGAEQIRNGLLHPASGRRHLLCQLLRVVVDSETVRRLYRLTALGLGMLVVAGGIWASRSDPASAQAPAADLVRLACSIPHQWLLRTWRGYRSDRGPNLQLLPKYPNFIGSGYPHVGPWAYDQNVPVLWYGPGHIKPVGSVSRPVTLVDIAPTEAKLMRFDFPAADGSPLQEALVSASGDAPPPRLVVTLVWDAGGRNVLSTWPDEWPYLRSLIPEGTWYQHATVGSSPSSTAQDHANIGTGAYPRNSGIIAHHMRIGSRIVGPFISGPNLLILPTLADLYDRAMGGRARVGEVATVNIHLGMLGHGSFFGGGDRDSLILREQPGASTQGAEGGSWNIPGVDAPYFRFPSWVKDLPPLSHDFSTADAADGVIDGTWQGLDIAEQKGGFDTPARIPNQERVIEELIKRENFGADEVPDLLQINFKLIDEVGHIWTMNSLQMRDSVRVQDRYLKVFVDFLNQQVGEGKWAMVVTADHGAVPNVDVSGAFQISTGALTSQLENRFDSDSDDVPVFDGVYNTGAFVNETELQENGFSLDDVARFVLTLTEAQTAGEGVAVAADRMNDLVFQAAYPSAIISSLPCLPEARQ